MRCLLSSRPRNPYRFRFPIWSEYQIWLGLREARVLVRTSPDAGPEIERGPQICPTSERGRKRVVHSYKDCAPNRWVMQGRWWVFCLISCLGDSLTWSRFSATIELHGLGTPRK